VVLVVVHSLFTRAGCILNPGKGEGQSSFNRLKCFDTLRRRSLEQEQGNRDVEGEAQADLDKRLALLAS
jgi:hypothetical protein